MTKRNKITYLFSTAITLLYVFSVYASSRGLISVNIKARDNAGAPYAGEVKLYDSSHALIIGIDNYTLGWPRLSCAVKDAKLVAKALRIKGFNVILKKNLNSRELKRAFEEFFVFKGEDPQARLFVWFAGHGHTLDGEGFLVPADAPKPDKGAQFKYKALSMRRFGEFVRLAKSKHAFAVFDSCFSGTIFDTRRTTPPAAITRATTFPVRQFLTSGDANQSVSDDGRFRKIFIRAIRGVERADANADGYLTGSELGIFLTDRITNLTRSRQTPRYGKLRDENYDRGDFVFLLPRSHEKFEKLSDTEAGSPAPSAPQTRQSRVDKEMLFWQSIQHSDNPILFKAYLEKFPNGTFVPIAKVKIENLKKKREVASIPPEVSKPKLYVETEPQNTTVKILNIRPKFHQGIKLKPGSYHLEISSEGYETKKQWVILAEGKDKNLKIHLEKKRLETPKIPPKQKYESPVPKSKPVSSAPLIVTTGRLTEDRERPEETRRIVEERRRLASLPSSVEPKKPVVIFEDDFDSENGGSGKLNYDRFKKWYVPHGTVDLIGNGFYAPQGTGLFIDLDGSKFNGGALKSKTSFRLTPGRYGLAFAVWGNENDDNTIRVRLGDVYKEDFLVKSADPYKTIIREISISKTIKARLVFEHLWISDNYGALLDNVVLKKLP